jgi:hypothetical protein
MPAIIAKVTITTALALIAVRRAFGLADRFPPRSTGPDRCADGGARSDSFASSG